MCNERGKATSSDYIKQREALYGPLRHVFSWDCMYGSEYALADIHYISEQFHQELLYAAQKLGEIYGKISFFLQNSPDELYRMLGLPPETFQAVRVPVFSHLATSIGRFDFAQTPQGLKMLEFNADTPTSIVEVFYVNQKVCDFYQVPNPNQGCEQHLDKAFQQIIERYRELGYPTQSIVFSALDWHDEDRDTTRYLLRQSGLPARFVALQDLRVYEDRLCYFDNGNYVPIDVWYRLHALEKLAEEKAEDGYPTGAHVLDLVARKRLALINPPSAFIAQSKALQALIWNLHEERQFFSAAEHEIIEAYMLPTYLENRFAGKECYVSKPFFGREGGAIRLCTSEGNIIAQDQGEDYWEQPVVYQRMAELESIAIQTIRGNYAGRALWGAFLIGGQASGIGLRLGDLITGNLSYFLPVALTNKQ